MDLFFYYETEDWKNGKPKERMGALKQTTYVVKVNYPVSISY